MKSKAYTETLVERGALVLVHDERDPNAAMFSQGSVTIGYLIRGKA
jgi:hypothetical protein